MSKTDTDVTDDNFPISNSQIAEYLDFYVSMIGSPNYAVLINGEWGSGKTWFIKQFRDDQEKKSRQFLYASLYGVSSISEIEDQFFQQLHPILSSKAFKVGAKILKDTIKGAIKVDFHSLGHLSGDASAQFPTVDLKNILESSENRILIFDDLERCKMPPEEILGYINTFVEHQGQKAIVLAHEKEIKSSKEFKRKNEKLIGRRFTINTDFQGALSFFLNELENSDAKKPLEANSKEIQEVFRKAQHKNLRTLRHGIIEYQRLFSTLPEKAQKHEDFQTSCIQTFFTVCVELKSGRLAPTDLKDLRHKQAKILAVRALSKNLNKKDKTEPLPIEISIERIHRNSFEEIIPTELFLYHFFEHGSVPESVVNNFIEGCQYFFSDNTPAWKRLWHIWDLEEAEFKAYIGSVCSDFYSYKFVTPGELKHVVALLLFFSKNRILPASLSKTVKAVNKVVSYMDKHNLIKADEINDRIPVFDDSYEGLAFLDSRSNEFQNVRRKIKAYQERRNEEKVKEESSNLAELMIKDSKAFLWELTISGSNSTKFYRLPVLKNVPIESFLDSYLRMEAKKRTDIYGVFSERYKHLGEESPLIEELAWLKKLRIAAKTKQRNLKQPTRFHLEHLEREGISTAIKLIEEHKKRQTVSKGASK